MPQATLLEFHDKYRFVERAQEMGLRVPRSMLSQDPAVARFVASHDFVCKPRFSSSGRSVVFGSAGETPAVSGGDIVQERIRGEEYSCFSIAHDGRCVARVVYRATVIDGSVAVAFERVDEPGAISRWVDDFVRQTSWSGFVAFDFIVGSDGDAVALECNPRVTSGIHFLTRDAIMHAIRGYEMPDAAFRTDTHLTESYSCFTVALRSIFKRQSAANNWRQLHLSRDVTWSPDDPWPFLLMMINTAPLITRAAVTRQSFAAAAVGDIEWRSGLDHVR